MLKRRIFVFTFGCKYHLVINVLSKTFIVGTLNSFKCICSISPRLSSHFIKPLSTKEGKHAVISKDKCRFEEFTPLGKAILDGVTKLSTPHVRFRVMSYNVLAQTHMMTHSRNYKYCPRECLNWSFRKGILIHELEVEKPDIFCLQEVEGRHRTELLDPLRKLGYDALYVPRGEGKPDGCAFLYNTSKFQISDFSPVLYFRPEIPLLDRPNVGMVARLELCDHPGNYITVANTHFLYNQRRLDIKICQLQMLLAETERLAFAEAPNKYHPVILTGDLNVNSDTILIYLLRRRLVDCQDHNTKRWRPVRMAEGIRLSIPDQLLQHYLNISPDCQYTDVVEGRKKGIKDVRRTENLQESIDDYRVFPESSLGKRIKNTENTIANCHESVVSKQGEKLKECERGVVRHGFPFIDVYEHPELDKRNNQYGTTPNPKLNVYDYMFYSGDPKLGTWRNRSTPYQPVKGQLQLLSRLRLPTPAEKQLYFPSLPNYACGSDHLPLSATFLLPVQ